MCVTETAEDFETATSLLEQNSYDMTVLDVMGVNGYELLKRANQKEIPSVMLTAHALTKDNFIKSMDKGARAYLSKDKMFEIDTILEDVLEEKDQPAGTRGKWFDPGPKTTGGDMNASLLQSKKVLVVDDESDVFETLTDLLNICHTETAHALTAANLLRPSRAAPLLISPNTKWWRSRSLCPI